MILHKQNRVLASVAGKDSGYSYRTGRTERWRHWWYLPTPPLLSLHTAQAAYCGHLRLSARAFSALDVSEVKVAQSCPILCSPMDYTVHGIV